MNPATVFLVFELEGRQFALHVGAVERVVYAVEITGLPHTPDIVMGVINVEGRVVSVFNVRRRFGLPERAVDPHDHFILARTSHREVAIPVDRAVGVIECPAEDVEVSKKILPGIDYVEGVVKRDDGLVLIQDLEKFLSLDEEEALGRAVKAR